eukprot:COSAG06_NODE_2385_length_6974_cov_3.851491_5_plen_98_part_00
MRRDLKLHVRGASLHVRGEKKDRDRRRWNARSLRARAALEGSRCWPRTAVCTCRPAVAQQGCAAYCTCRLDRRRLNCLAWHTTHGATRQLARRGILQ